MFIYSCLSICLALYPNGKYFGVSSTEICLKYKGCSTAVNPQLRLWGNFFETSHCGSQTDRQLPQLSGTLEN